MMINNIDSLLLGFLAETVTSEIKPFTIPLAPTGKAGEGPDVVCQAKIAEAEMVVGHPVCRYRLKLAQSEAQ